MSQHTWDIRFIDLAKLISTWSKDPSTQVGAVITRPNRSVASVGFNGFPMRMTDSVDLYTEREEKYSRIVHGEVNALIFAKEPVTGYTLYTYPFIPCDRCCVQMIQAGINRIVSLKPPKESLDRWAAAFDKTKKYCQESGVELVELELS